MAKTVSEKMPMYVYLLRNKHSFSDSDKGKTGATACIIG